MPDYSKVPSHIARAISSLRWNDTQRICYVSKEGYFHTIQFDDRYTKHRQWYIDGNAKPLSTIVWQLTENVENDSVRLLTAGANAARELRLIGGGA